jgi:hypothetical protein
MMYRPSDYYGTFVDLYLLAGGRCTAFNIGGYGRWSNLLSPNASCYINHHRHRCAAPSEPANASRSASDGRAASPTGLRPAPPPTIRKATTARAVDRGAPVAADGGVLSAAPRSDREEARSV